MPLLQRILFPFLVTAFCATSALAQDPISFTNRPKTNQLYPRNPSSNLATVEISGMVTDGTVDSVIVRHAIDGAPEDSETFDVTGTASFVYTTDIPAALEAHGFTIGIYREEVETLVHTADNVVAGDVFVLQGQSNAVAQLYSGSAAENESNWVRSYGTSDADPDISYADTTWHIAEGDTKYLPGSVGQIGIRIAGRIVDTYGVPVAVLNGAEGGRPIVHFQRKDSNPTTAYKNYGRLLTRAQRAGVDDAVRAIVWYQGEHDGTGDADTDPPEYKNLFSALRDDWKEDFAGLERMYVFQIRDGCGSPSDSLRDMQWRMTNSWNDVEIMSTTGLDGHYLDHEPAFYCHWAYDDGYKELADRIFRQMQRDIYDSGVTEDVDPTVPLAAYFAFSGRNEVTVEMLEPTALTMDPNGWQLFGISDASVSITSGSVVDNKVILALSDEADELSTLSYSDIKGAHPWITNRNGIGLVTFVGLPILLNGDILPVELVAFTATQGGEGEVLLRWKTDAEVAGFDVLHQADYGFRGASNARETKEEVGGFEDLHRTNSELRDPGSEWKIAGYVEGNRSSEAVESYSYSIPDLESGHHFFRLKQINLDGSVGYSREVIVTIDLPSAFVIGDVYPNPVIDMAILPFHVATTQVVSATLHDVLGRQIRSLGQIQAVADTRHAFQIDAVDLPAGSYFVLLRGERFAATKKVLTVR